MTDLEFRLGAAVHKLTEVQQEAVTARDDDGVFLGIHTVTHEPLLRMLMEGTGAASGMGGNGSGVPIDADALILADHIYRTLADWAHWLPFTCTRDLIPAVKDWYRVHENRAREGHMSEESELIAVRAVESWVASIEAKFNPDKFIEFEAACPKCGLRRIVVNEEERFAIKINLTQAVAECANPDCNAKWEGLKGLSEMRYLSNLLDETTEQTVTPTL